VTIRWVINELVAIIRKRFEQYKHNKTLNYVTRSEKALQSISIEQIKEFLKEMPN
jgi:hypothetical protein